jgi:hypothetical protein
MLIREAEIWSIRVQGQPGEIEAQSQKPPEQNELQAWLKQ